MNRTLLCAIASVGVILGFGGCPAQNGSSGTGSLRLLVTDKPFPFEHITSATVTITEVRAHRTSDGAADNGNANDNSTAVAGAQADADDNANANANTNANENANSSDDSDDEGESGWVTLYSGEKTFDLLDLRNGRTDLLADADIPAGSYNQLRLVVTAGEVTLTDGRVFPLKVPSGEQSGIKLHFTFEVQDGEQTQLLLDVDLSRAFSAIPSGHIDDAGTITSFKFSPSIAMRLIDLLEAGSISGLVSDDAGAPLAGVAVTAYRVDGSAEEEASTTVTEADGTYRLIGLTTGTYRLALSKAGYVDGALTNISVQAGQATEGANATLSAAAAQ
jgi:hypothetical protein